MKHIIDYYIIACVFLTWLGISFWGIYVLRSKWQTLRFKAAEATISNLSVREVAAVSDYDFSEFGKIDHIIVVSYEFTVDGKNFKGKDEGNIDNRKGEELRYKGEKKEGDLITIYYDPDNPKENYLEKHYVIAGFFIIGFAQLFLLLGFDLIDRWIK